MPDPRSSSDRRGFLPLKDAAQIGPMDVQNLDLVRLSGGQMSQGDTNLPQALTYATLWRPRRVQVIPAFDGGYVLDPAQPSRAVVYLRLSNRPSAKTYNLYVRFDIEDLPLAVRHSWYGQRWGDSWAARTDYLISSSAAADEEEEEEDQRTGSGERTGSVSQSVGSGMPSSFYLHQLLMLGLEPLLEAAQPQEPVQLAGWRHGPAQRPRRMRRAVPQVEHIDGDGLNCTRENLRVLPEGRRRRTQDPKRTVGAYQGVDLGGGRKNRLRGILWNREQECWEVLRLEPQPLLPGAQARLPQKTGRYLGKFERIEEAVAAYHYGMEDDR